MLKLNFLNLNPKKLIIIVVLFFAFAFSASSAYAALTLGTDTISSDGVLTLTPATNTIINGDVGIGTSTPAAVLDILKNQNAITNFQISNLTDGTASVTRGQVNNVNGGVVIFAAAPSWTGITEFANKAGIYSVSGGTATPLGNLVIASRASAGGIDFYTGGSAAANKKMVISSAGNVGIGDSAPQRALHVVSQISGGMMLDNFNASPDPELTFRVARGTQALPTAVQLNDELFSIGARAYGATAFSAATKAHIRGFAAESWSDTAQGTYITFATTPIGTVARADRMRITDTGNVGIGTTPNAAALLDVSSITKGFLPPRMTTTQRDAIATPPAGLMIYNTTTNKLNFYNGTAWEVVTSVVGA